MIKEIRASPVSYACAVLFALVLIRAVTIGLFDLIDPTESRYAFIAQEMILSGDWLTPKLPLPEGITPYLGKPPLHFWLTAFSMKIFGMDAWVTRLPSFFGWLIIGVCSYLFGAKFFNRETGVFAAIITLSSGLLYFLAASSTIDITLSAWITGALTGFAFATQRPRSERIPVAGYCFFIFSALAFLTKGPVAMILIGMPLFFWLLSREARQNFPPLPWVGGLAIFFIIVAPWFYVSEQQNPGFLYYFFVQENFLRFLVSDYGDRFGSGHVHPRGSAIWMMAVGMAPWSLLLLVALAISKEIRQQLLKPPLWLRFALFWGLSPMLFFSLARQLHAAYLVPGFAGAGVVLAVTVDRNRSIIGERFFVWLTRLTVVFCVGAFPVSVFFQVDTFHIILAAALALPCVALCGAPIYSGGEKKLILCFSAAVIAVYGGVTALYSRHAGLIKSSREALSFVAQELKGQDAHVAFFSDNAYSFYYYSRIWQEQLGAPISPSVVDEGKAIANPPTHLIVNRSDISKMPDRFRSLYQEKKSFGKWRWWQKLPEAR